MKDKDKNKKERKKNILPEPAVSYITNSRLHFFSSFEDASKDEAKFIVDQSPIDRLRQTVELILRVHNVTRQDLKEKKSSSRINIIRTK